MILSFSTQLNGKPTYFVERIWASFPNEDPFNIDLFYLEAKKTGKYTFEDQVDRHPKIHSIREDKNNRWKVGMMIDFFINNRTKNVFCFAPRIQVLSTQRVFMTYLPHLGNGFEMSIDGTYCCDSTIHKLALNDGFDSVQDFQNYFISQMKDGEFSGKIIHWTDFKY